MYEKNSVFSTSYTKSGNGLLVKFCVYELGLWPGCNCPVILKKYRQFRNESFFIFRFLLFFFLFQNGYRLHTNTYTSTRTCTPTHTHSFSSCLSLASVLLLLVPGRATHQSVIVLEQTPKRRGLTAAGSADRWKRVCWSEYTVAYWTSTHCSFFFFLLSSQWFYIGSKAIRGNQRERHHPEPKYIGK